MIDKEKLINLIGDEGFEKYYLEFLASRFTTGSVQMETDSDIASYNNGIMYSNNLLALKYLLHCDEKLRIDIIQKVAKIIDEDDNDKGFRNTTIQVGGSNVERSNPKDIYMKMYSLLDSYYNIWSYNPNPFFKEAYFHLQFLTIHPFSDGNGRTARIITATNLLKQGLLPGIITSENKKEYCDIIESQNAEALAEFFERLSFKEEMLFTNIYRKYNEVENEIKKL